MKNLAVVAAIVAIFSTSVVSASVDPIKPRAEKIETKKGKRSLKNLLEKPAVVKTLDEQVKDILKSERMEVTEDAKVVVRFMINSDNEIVVVDTDTTQDWAANMVKRSLNDRKVENISNAQKNRFYYIAVALKAN